LVPFFHLQHHQELDRGQLLQQFLVTLIVFDRSEKGEQLGFAPLKEFVGHDFLASQQPATR
jgi:hypothetical protein